MKNVTYEVSSRVGILSTKGSYTKEINVISWNNDQPVHDIRVWQIDANKSRHPLKGITLRKDELIALKKILEKYHIEE